MPEQDRYGALFAYLVSGLLHYGTSDRSHVYYPGASSTHGAKIDAMEGFCRTLPMIGAWLHSGRATVIQNVAGQEIDLVEVARAGLLAGTNPNARGFWGNIGEGDQRIVEAADIALSIWLLREHLWSQLSASEKEMISIWLRSVNGKTIPDNNWHLFPVMVNEVLCSLGCPCDAISSRMHYLRLKAFYKGNGWFSDGPDGAIDYYNAWAIHYSLFWINLINPGLDPDFIDGSLDEFARNYKYFFSTEGIPIMGRSICYRMAAPAPLVAAASKGMQALSLGMARRALDCVWRYFIARGAIHRGTITQGYWHQDIGLLDDYSGPGSSMWSTRSLTLAFFNPTESDFWAAPLEDLPVERDNFRVVIPEIQWEITGSKRTREVRIVNINRSTNPPRDQVKQSILYRFLIFALGLPYRSQIAYARNGVQVYSSSRPFWLTELQHGPRQVQT